MSIAPDCKTQYGCLFCVHYLVHSDEADIHKLLSFLYVIEGVRSNAPNFEFSEEIFKEVIIRVDFILDAISERSIESANLVMMVRKKCLISVFLLFFGSGDFSVMKEWGYISNGQPVPAL